MANSTGNPLLDQLAAAQAKLATDTHSLTLLENNAQLLATQAKVNNPQVVASNGNGWIDGSGVFFVGGTAPSELAAARLAMSNWYNQIAALKTTIQQDQDNINSIQASISNDPTAKALQNSAETKKVIGIIVAVVVGLAILVGGFLFAKKKGFL